VTPEQAIAALTERLACNLIARQELVDAGRMALGAGDWEGFMAIHMACCRLADRYEGMKLELRQVVQSREMSAAPAAGWVH
jgi:hypothetical protein